MRAMAAAAMLTVAGTVIVRAGQLPTFSTGVEQVRVDVLVTENGRALRDLQIGDFEVRDDGVVQQIDLVSTELPLNVILALDRSQSMAGERLRHLRLAAHAVLDNLTPQDRAGLVTFSDVIQRPEPLTRGVSDVRTAVDAIAPVGGTALVDGVYAALTLAGSDAGRDLLIVFSDGVDTGSVLSAARVLESADRVDAVVYGVALGPSGRAGFLEQLSAQTGGQFLGLASTTDLQSAFVAILTEFRQRYVIAFTPRGVSRDGRHRLEVRVKGRPVNVNARRGYTAAPVVSR